MGLELMGQQLLQHANHKEKLLGQLGKLALGVQQE
jgi:hypothetical protein